MYKCLYSFNHAAILSTTTSIRWLFTTSTI